MTELLVLITGFMAGLRLWLGSFDIVVARRMTGISRSRKLFLAAGRFGTCLTFSALTYAIASPGGGGAQQNILLTLYLIGAALLLTGSVGELTTYDWSEADGKGLPR